MPLMSTRQTDKSSDQMATDLRNQNAGWVTRRDGAEGLGRLAAHAAEVLREHASDTDRDVRTAVRTALGRVAAEVRGMKPVPQDRSYTLAELAKACERTGKRELVEHGDGYAVTVKGKDGREQTVFIVPAKRKDGVDLVRVYTRCGPAQDDQFRWALESNLSLSHGAFALSDEFANGGGAEFVIINVFIASEATPEEVKASVKEMAFYGDWLEQKLTGQDTL